MYEFFTIGQCLKTDCPWSQMVLPLKFSMNYWFLSNYLNFSVYGYFFPILLIFLKSILYTQRFVRRSSAPAKCTKETKIIWIWRKRVVGQESRSFFVRACTGCHSSQYLISMWKRWEIAIFMWTTCEWMRVAYVRNE